VPSAVPGVATAVVACALVARPLAAQAVDVVRGRVVGPERQPVEGARVTVTSVSGNVNRGARTDRNGRFTVTFPGGDGDYFVSFAALGYAPRRFEVKRVADEDFLVADATLQRAAAQLDTVRVRGERGRVARGEAQADVGGTERGVDGGLVAPDQMGDLAAMAAAQPGVDARTRRRRRPGRATRCRALEPDQIQTRLTALNFGGKQLPTTPPSRPRSVTRRTTCRRAGSRRADQPAHAARTNYRGARGEPVGHRARSFSGLVPRGPARSGQPQTKPLARR
jgi:hypothetical protein